MSEQNAPRTDALVETFPKVNDLRGLCENYNELLGHARTLETELSKMTEQRDWLVKAAKLAVLNFKRTNASDEDALGDDDFGAWNELNKAIHNAEGK